MKSFIELFMLLKLKMLKSLAVLKAMFSKKALFLSLPMGFTISRGDYISAMGVLCFFMVCDFGTGIGASYCRRKKKKITNPELVKERLISSSKLKKSGVKILLYFSTILLSFLIHTVFKLKKFQFSFSDKEFDIVLVIIAFWTVVEFYSIVFENFNDMGLDVWGMITKVIDKTKSVKNKIEE